MGCDGEQALSEEARWTALGVNVFENEKRKVKRDKAGDRQAMFVRQSEPAESRRAATSTSRVGFSLSSYIEKTKPRTMIRSLLAVVGMATMAGEFVVGFGCGFIWMAARYFGRKTAADSAGDGNNPLVV